MGTERKNLNIGRKTCDRATSSTRNSSRKTLRLNPALYNVKPATKRLSCVAVQFHVTRLITLYYIKYISNKQGIEHRESTRWWICDMHRTTNNIIDSFETFRIERRWSVKWYFQL
jgi:hypothetical protein